MSKDELIAELRKSRANLDSERESHEKVMNELRNTLHGYQTREETYTKAYLTSPDSTININRLSDDLFEYVDEGFSRITGYSEKETIGKTSLEMNLWIDTGDRIQLVKELQEKGEVRNFKTKFLTKSGTVVHVIISATLIDLDGIRHILNITRDITDSIMPGEAFQMLSMRHETMLKTIIDNIPDQVYYKDRNSRFVLCNMPVAKLAGCSSEKELLGKSDFDFHPHHLAQQYYNDEQSLMENDQKLQNHEEQIQDRKTGELRWNLSTKVPVKDAGGNIIGLIGINRDITESKTAVEEVKLKNELLQTINAEKDKFFSVLAHDLKSPMSAFLGATEILVEEIQNMTLDDIKALTTSMRESAINIFGLLTNLLEWSRLKRGTMSFTPETFNLRQKAAAGIQSLKQMAGKKEIELVCNIPGDIEISADPHMFEAIIRNLVSNAVKFTPKKGKICISALTDDNKTEIRISDTGIGMSKELQCKLFLLNERTNRPGTEGEPSTGLGLLLCREFIEKHNAKLRIESEEGKGSIFSFTVEQAQN